MPYLAFEISYKRSPDPDPQAGDFQNLMTSSLSKDSFPVKFF